MTTERSILIAVARADLFIVSALRRLPWAILPALAMLLAVAIRFIQRRIKRF